MNHTRRTWEMIKVAAQGFAWFHGMAQAAAQEAAAREAARPPDPMEGLASSQELDAYKYRPGSFYLGQIHEEHGRKFEAGVSDDRGVFLVAGPRTGKGSSLIIPNLIRWPGPVFVIDPKGENASITAMRRARREDARGTGTSVRDFIGQKVAILDPLGQVKGPARKFKVAYNPFSDLKLDGPGGLQFIRALAEAVVPTEQGEGAHFSSNAQMVLCGVIEAVIDQEPNRNHSLAFVDEVLDREWDEIVSYLEKTKTRAGLARKARGLLTKVGDNEGGSFFSTIAKNLQWLAEPGIQTHLDGTDFSLVRAIQEGWSLYVCVPPLRVAEFKHWLRLIVNIALTAKDPDIYGHGEAKQQTLFLLDEFPVLGHFKIIEDTAGYLGSFGIKLVPVIQNIGQIKRDYGKNWETFMGTSGALVAFGLNDGDTEGYVAGRIGKVRAWQSSAGTNTGFGGGGPSSGQTVTGAWHERPIRFANDVREQSARETMRAFVIPSGKGFTIRRIGYAQPGENISKNRDFEAPAFIKSWEDKYGVRFRGK